MAAKQNVINDALQLSEAERLEVAEALYESLQGPADTDAQEAWTAEIERRIHAIDSGTVKLVPWSQARSQIASDSSDAEASR